MNNCPFCDYQGEFKKYNGRDKARCPNCLCLERDRLAYFYLYRRKVFVKSKFLHFAPEPCLSKLVKSFEFIDYLSVDIDPSKAMQKEDITNLSFKDNEFDTIYCSHILEHIEDDQKAINELYRVAKKDSNVIILVPIF
jgi:SAM-dependent methyltransferase